MTQILVGADPEVFVKQHGKFVSAHGLINGNKEKPQAVPFGAVQVDGMALEFNINPAKDTDEFVHNITAVFEHLKSMVPGYEVAVVPVADFSLDYIASQPLEARELGCNPDFDAYTGGVNQKPQAERPMRTAAGHVHIGWGEDLDGHGDQCRAATIQMDFFLGLPSLFYDDDVRRRSMYGKAGCYRPKSYGVEYRTLSNAWLMSKERMAWVHRATVRGMQELMSGNFLFEKFGDISNIINTSDKEAAMKIIREANLEVCHG